MKRIVAPILLLLLLSQPIFAASLATPILSPPIATVKFFDPNRLLTSGGVRYSAATDLTLEPELGFGYRASEREYQGGIEESIHRVHAQAGWRLSLADTLYFSAAAKFPLLTIEAAERYTGQDLGIRPGYDFTRGLRNPFTWTGEVGIRVSSWSDLTLYYDQSPVTGWLAGGPQQEERIGTRLIFKFK
jgi:hypothetical protein